MSTVEELQARVAELEAQIASNEASANDLKVALQSAQTELGASVAKSAELTSNYESRIAALQAELDALKTSYNEQSVSLQATTASLQTTRQHNDELQVANIAALAERDKVLADTTADYEARLQAARADELLANSALQATQAQFASMPIEVTSLRTELDVEKRANASYLAQVQGLLSEKATREAAMERMCKKTFMLIKPNEIIACNAVPADMEFVESKRPWIAQKLSQGQYLLRIAGSGLPEQTLADLGYEQRSV